MWGLELKMELRSRADRGVFTLGREVCGVLCTSAQSLWGDKQVHHGDCGPGLGSRLYPVDESVQSSPFWKARAWLAVTSGPLFSLWVKKPKKYVDFSSYCFWTRKHPHTRQQIWLLFFQYLGFGGALHCQKHGSPVAWLGREFLQGRVYQRERVNR